MKRLIAVPLVLAALFAAPATAGTVEDLKDRIQMDCADPDSCLCIDEYVLGVHVYYCGWHTAG